MINVNLLPKNLRRVREPGYWRLLAILFPVLVFGVIFFLQTSAYQTVQNREQEVQQREDRLALLQDALREQRELQQAQARLRELLAIAEAVRENRIVWTEEINAMLENLPARGDAVTPNIDFQNLTMNAIDPPREDPNRYMGAPVIAEMSVTGNVRDTDILSDFIASLEASSEFGVAFQSATLEEDSGLYRYNLVIGALAGGEQ